MRKVILLALGFILAFGQAHAQYFGRNKPIYQKQDFQVTETEHFEIYEYLDNPEKRDELANAAEVWYAMHLAVLQDTFYQKNPMIIYNDHAGFQQTNAISGGVSVGTGGVTEGLRNRVIFPVAPTNQQTHHVLGHELVHAFQYRMILGGDSTNIQNLANLPLWMIEGLAEYLSIGRVDAHTALWMRDAVINDDLPRIRDLNNSKYFPYRWGQSFWAFVTGIYGDEVIRPLFVNTAKYGLDPAIRITLGTTPDSLSSAWQRTLREHYGRWVSAKDAQQNLPGKRLLSDDNAGRMNISPVLSPNGKYVIFLSEKNIFTTDLFLADARTGKIIKKVASSAQDGHIDQFNFIESAGTWSPDSKKFAFDVYEKGRSTLVIKDVLKGKTLEKISLPGVPSFSNPAWSPDGKTIVVSGLVNGQTDLYAYDLRTKKVRQLTNDNYSEILPAWSADGSSIAFSTDHFSLQRGRSNGAWQMNLAVMDFISGSVEQIDLFPGADNMNPQFDNTGNILFLSNRDGFRNLYKYDPANQKTYQLTEIATGITGITPYAPALSVAEDRDRILYTHYFKGAYVIYSARAENFEEKEVSSSEVDMLAATLPPFNPRQRDVVNTNLRLIDNTSKATNTLAIAKKYKPKFALAYAGGSTGVGVATGNASFGATTGLAGGVDLLFNDILGNNQLYAGLALNGEITDAAGQFSYINQKSRINWGFNLSHIPIRSQSFFPDPDLQPGLETTLRGDTFIGYTDYIYIQRVFQERIGVFAFYPLSVTKRIEIGSAFEFYHQRLDEYRFYYDPNGFAFGSERQRIPTAAENFRIPSINAAFVGDNSYFGFTAPLQGWRYRIGLEQFFGDFRFSGILLDGRKYFYLRPFSLAIRGISYNRFGGNANNIDQVFPLFAGQPNFVRGYLSFFSNDFINQNPEFLEIMAGSKILVANAEIRLPFFGPKGLALLPFNFLPADLNVFFDAGMGWFTADDLKKEDPNPDDGMPHVYHKPLLSAGFSFRLNLFGALVLEPFWAVPLSLEKDRRSLNFGLNILPGW